jgi:hypothetical protein
VWEKKIRLEECAAFWELFSESGTVAAGAGSGKHYWTKVLEHFFEKFNLTGGVPHSKYSPPANIASNILTEEAPKCVARLSTQ